VLPADRDKLYEQGGALFWILLRGSGGRPAKGIDETPGEAVAGFAVFNFRMVPLVGFGIQHTECERAFIVWHLEQNPCLSKVLKASAGFPPSGGIRSVSGETPGHTCALEDPPRAKP
jgi:hypothetical protein